MTAESVLVVDDNPANLKLARVLLAAEGFEVRTATSAREALATLEAWRPRLILMDLQLPEIDGFELTRRLKADPRYRHIAIVAVTAYAMRGDEERALAAGCDGYVAKPIAVKTLPEVLRRHLRGGGPGDAA